MASNVHDELDALAGRTIDELDALAHADPAKVAMQRARAIVAGDIPDPNQEKPGFWDRMSFGIHKAVSGAQNLDDLVNPYKQLAYYLDPEYKAKKEAEFNQRVEENQQTQEAIDKGRGVSPNDPWYKKIDPVELGGEAAATAPLMAAGGVGSGVTKALTAGAEQGGLQGGIIGASEGKPIQGAATGAAGGAAFSGALHLGGAGLINYFASKLPDSLRNAAVQKILERIGLDEKAGGVSAQDALDAVNAARAAGKPLTLADAGGSNVQGLAGYVARRPGESREIANQFLDERDAAAPGRLNDDVAKYINGGESMHHTTQALLEARSAAAQPAYELAMDPSKPVDSPTIRAIVSDPTVRSLMNKGIESQRLEALAAGKPFDPTIKVADADTAGSVIGANGLPTKQTSIPNMRLLDAAKRGLDQEIEGERNELTGRLSQRGLMLDRVRQKLVGELDVQNPDYAAARAAWGGPSASMDAMRAGQAIFNKKPEEIASEFEGLPDSDKEFYRLGVADKIKEKIGKTGFGGDEAKSILKNEWMKGQLKPIFRSENEFNKFVEGVDTERQMFDTRRNLLGGSQTAARLAEDQSSEVPSLMRGVGAAVKLKTGNLIGAARDFMEMRRLHGLRENPELNAEISRILFDPKISDLSAPPSPGSGGLSRVSDVASSISSAATPALVDTVDQTDRSTQPVQ